MNSVFKVAGALALAAILLSVGFLGGFAFSAGRFIPSLNGLAAPKDTVSAHVAEVQGLLNERALEPPSETSATAGAVQGLLGSSGDKYALYFDPERLDMFNADTMGEFGGIGVVLGEKNGAAYITDVYEGTPAARAKLKSGDIFVAIDAERRANWTTEEVVKRVRGTEGTKVKLTLFRPTSEKIDPRTHPGKPLGKEFSVEITRAVIALPNVESELKGGVGYIRLGQFNAKASDEIATAVRELTGKGARSFVLDLRDNPGGLLDQAVKVSSLFIDGGVVVRVEARGKAAQEERAIGQKATDAPLVLLVNGNSASASEIVGGALQDYGRAKLVGEQSFGKGSVQSMADLSFGGAIKFTTAHYLTPKGRVINGKGLTPDVVVKMDIEKQADEKTDVQLKRALEIAAGGR